MEPRHAGRRLLALLLLVLASGLVVVIRGDVRGLSERVMPDPSWMIDLENLWVQGQLSGRDFFYTYGPLAQGIALVSRLWRHHLSPLDGWLWTPLVGGLFAYGLVAGVLACVPRLSARRAVGIFVIVWLMPLPWYAGRLLLVLLSLVAFARGLAAPSRAAAVAWAVGAALAAWAGQLYTFEALIYVSAGWVALIVAAGIVARTSREPGEGSATRALVTAGGAAIGTLVLLEASVEIFFRATSATYRSLEYFVVNWHLLRGYNLTMGTPWLEGLPHPSAIELALVLIVAAGAEWAWTALRGDRDRDRDARLVRVAMAIASLLVLKGAIVRADLPHVHLACIPAWLCLLIVATDRRDERARRIVACIAVLWLFAVFQVDYSQVGSLTKKLHSLRHVRALDPSRVESGLRAQLTRDWVVAFPYGNHLATAAGRRSLAPMPQAYFAPDAFSQDRYIEELERHRGQIDVIVGDEDYLEVWMADNVPGSARVPKLYRYLLENFEWRGGPVVRDSFRVLSPRAAPQPLIASPIDDGPCALVAVEVQIDYGPLASLGRPLGVFVDLDTEDGPLRTPLVAMEAGRPFSALLYTGGAPSRASALFGPEPVAGVRVRGATLVAQPRSRFAVAPSRAEVRRLECVVKGSAPWWGGPRAVAASTGAPLGGKALVHVEGRDLVIHGGYRARLRTSGVGEDLCLRSAVGWNDAVVPAADHEKSKGRDGVAVTIELADDKGARIGEPIREMLEVGQPARPLVVPLPAGVPLRITMAVDPLKNDSWDWTRWRDLQVSSCQP